ncbi:hypothetical protein BC332_06440 [Capsicum chinense]|nr:hypothetical protein BC332_06440 [Capsicum chinense]
MVPIVTFVLTGISIGTWMQIGAYLLRNVDEWDDRVHLVGQVVDEGGVVPLPIAEGAMAGNGESVVAETKKIMNPNVEIDTSPPFESLKEAHDSEVVDVGKMEEQAIKFEKDLIVKEREALNALREVEEAKRFVEGLKVNLMQEASECLSSPAAELSIMENNTMNKELQQLSSDAEQFKKMTEASSYEVMKAMSEIERTKASIRMAEMRLRAAKKMEEAAKAVEAIAFADRKTLLDGKNSSAVVQHATEGITIPYEEYYALAWKAQQAEELCKTKFVDTNTVCRTNEEVAITKKMEETSKEIRHSRSSLEEALDNEDGTLTEHDGFYRERSEHTQLHYWSSKSKLRNPQSTVTSHGNPPSPLVDDHESDRKLILRDDHIVMGKHTESSTERKHVSFSQMLREQSGIILNPTKAMKDGDVHKQFITQKKRFGFIQVPLPKHNKKKTQPLNMR